MGTALCRELERWLNDVYSVPSMRLPALVDFLTQEPNEHIVLDFESKEKLEIVVKTSGHIRLYKAPHPPTLN